MSYNSIEDANDYIDDHFLQSSQEFTFWSGLEDTDKTVLLTRAFENIERLPFVGRKATTIQTTAFPRYINRHLVPVDGVMAAEVLEALAIGGALSDQRKKGVKSFSIGHLSETYVGSSSSVDPLNTVSDDTRRVLYDFLSGGYDICQH